MDRDWQEYYSSYVSTYLERDINELISTDSITFTKFLTAVAARTGEILNYANIASALNRAIKSPKIFFRDTGLACYLTRWLIADSLKCSAVAGNMFETFLVSEIQKLTWVKRMLFSIK